MNNHIYLTHNQGVVGSSPTGTTLKTKHLHFHAGAFSCLTGLQCIIAKNGW